MKQGKKQPTVRPGQYVLSSRSPFAVVEAYKSIRTNIMFSLPGTGCKRILITSSVPGEGKSTLSVNLSKAFAMSGERILLIDCDLRMSSTARILRISNASGLSDVLVGMADISDVIVHQADGLDVLPAGSIPPNPSELLGSENMRALLDRLNNDYKYIILDAPPITAVTDAVVLSSLVSGTVIAVRNNVANRRDLDRCVEQLQMADAKLLGFVFTCADKTGKSYQKNGYYSYYGYGNSAQSGSGRKNSHSAKSGSSETQPSAKSNSHGGRRVK